MTGPKILMDTNVWNYIVDADGIETLRKASRASGVRIVACPAVAYECLRVPDPVVRKRRGKALAREEWSRLMPEAFSEAEDMLAEIRRLRPEWLLGAPDLRDWYRNRG